MNIYLDGQLVLVIGDNVRQRHGFNLFHAVYDCGQLYRVLKGQIDDNKLCTLLREVEQGQRDHIQLGKHAITFKCYPLKSLRAWFTHGMPLYDYTCFWLDAWGRPNDFGDLVKCTGKTWAFIQDEYLDI